MSLSKSALPFPENANLPGAELLNGETRPQILIPGSQANGGMPVGLAVDAFARYIETVKAGLFVSGRGGESAQDS
jgi:hypothetical protein